MAKIALIGAGSATFAKTLIADILTYPGLDGAQIALMDINPERLDLSYRIVQRMIAEQQSRCTVDATLDRRAALTGADYVITAFQIGGVAAMELDFAIPGKYGVGQNVGDTANPGGIFRGLRTIPVLQEICREMEELCPDAVLLQYSNPMAINMWGVYASSGIKHVGLCHSVQGTMELLARYIKAPYNEISFKCAGINHMAWFLEYKWNGQDAYPLFRELYHDSFVYGKEPVRWDLFKHLGYWVTESSGHSSEYYPWFRKRPDTLEKMISKFTYINYESLENGATGAYLRLFQRDAVKHREQVDGWLNSAEPIPVKRSSEYGVQIINAIETNTPAYIHGNVQNTGLITNLPDGACVEVPMMVDGSGLRPLHVGKLPPQLAAVCRPHIAMHELTVLGSLHGDRDAIRQAVSLDPLTAAVCSLEEIEAMTTEMLEAQARWLPQFAK